MRYLLVVMALLLPLFSASAKPPSASAVEHAAQACTETGAFGRHFGEVQYGSIDTTADRQWAPFEKLTITAHRITAIATFGGKPDEDAFDLAHGFLKVFDKAVKAAGKLPHREAHGNGIAFRSGEQPDAGLEFDVHQEGQSVVADCIQQ